MSIIGDLVVKLRVDSGNLNQGLERAQTTLDKFGRNARKSTGGGPGGGGGGAGGLLGYAIGGAGMAGGVIVAKQAMDVIVGLSTASIQLASDAEKLRVKFEVLTGSQRAGLEMFREVERLSLSTALSFNDTADAATRLLATGVQQSEIITTLRMIGDLAMGDRHRIGLLAKAYTDVLAKTRLQGQELRQFAENGVPLIAELSKLLKVSRAEVIELSVAGELGFGLVKEALENLTGEGGRFHGMLGLLGEETSGLAQRALDAIQKLGREIGDSLVPAADLLLRTVIQITQFLTKWKVAFAGVTTFLLTLAFVGPTILLIMKLWTIRTWALATAQAAIVGMAGGWKLVTAGIASAAGMAAAAAVHMRELKKQKELAGAGAPIAEDLAAIDAEMKKMKEKMENIEKLTTSIASMEQVMLQGWEKKRNQVQEYADALFDVLMMQSEVDHPDLTEFHKKTLEFSASITGLADKIREARREMAILSGTASELGFELFDIWRVDPRLDQMLNEYRDLLTEIEMMKEDAKRLEEVTDFAKDVKDSLRSPMEEVIDELNLFTDMLTMAIEAGLLSVEQATAAITNKSRELGQGVDTQPIGPKPFEQGSAEAMRLVYGFKNKNPVVGAINKQTEKLINELQNIGQVVTQEQLVIGNLAP